MSDTPVTMVAPKRKMARPPKGCSRSLQTQKAKFGWALDPKYGFVDCFKCLVCKEILCEVRTKHKYTEMRKPKPGQIITETNKYQKKSKVSATWNCPKSLNCSKSVIPYELRTRVEKVNEQLPLPTKKKKVEPGRRVEGAAFKQFFTFLCDYATWAAWSNGAPIPDIKWIEDDE